MTPCIDHGKRGDKRGYAHNSRGRLHRVAYCEHHGLLLDSIKGWYVLHSCDNPRCVNPAHLRLGTHQDNMDDRRTRQRGGRAMAKINFEIAERIRAEYATGDFTQRELAERHGVGQYIISRVVNSKLWLYP